MAEERAPCPALDAATASDLAGAPSGPRAMSAELGGPPRPGSPFLPSELELQERFGHREQLDVAARRGIRDHLIDQHRQFFAQLPFLLVGGVDERGQPRASMLTGAAGFAFSPDPRRLRVNALACESDPFLSVLKKGAAIGLLGIELGTRRRNRLNGAITEVDAGGFTVEVGQSYGNCPQYIQSYDLQFVSAPACQPPACEVVKSSALTPEDRRLLERADAFYIASANLRADAGVARGADVSHRGGRPGFIGVVDDRTLLTPDFVGNFFFNTLGNLSVEPRAGLLFPDFDTGDLLLAAARAEVVWDGPEVAAFAGAERLVRFHLLELTRLRAVLPFRGTHSSDARELARTGTWAEAERAAAASVAKSVWRPFTVTRVDQESVGIRSFILEPADGGGSAPHFAGQFLPIRVPVSGGAQPLIRCYSLSDASNGRTYRISVKRDGRASTWLHENLTPSATLDVLPPRGQFVFHEHDHRPIALISAGVGVTPMVAILNSLLVNDRRERLAAKILFLHGARNGREHAFAAEVCHKARHHSNLLLHFAYSAPDEKDVLQSDFHSFGRIDRALLSQLLPSPEVDAYLCGPASFTQAMYRALREIGLPAAAIRYEVFRGNGPSFEVNGRSEADAPAAANFVEFKRSGRRQRWLAEFTSLLSCAEAAGILAPFGCRSGACGSCAVRLLGGEVDSIGAPVGEPAAGHVLICSVRPKLGSADAPPVSLDL